mgnify:CR=1 FL=1|jgi:hypothetical protein
MKFIKTSDDTYRLSCNIVNEHVDLSKIITFDLLPLFFDLNRDICEKTDLCKFDKNHSNLFLLFRHFFADIGEKQLYSYFTISREISDNEVTFRSTALKSTLPDAIFLDDNIERSPVDSCTFKFFTENIHDVQVEIDISLNKKIPVYLERFFATCLSKMVNRLKEFIENYSIIE